MECPVHAAPVYEDPFFWEQPMNEIEDFGERVGRRIREWFENGEGNRERRRRERERIREENPPDGLYPPEVDPDTL
jgi:hypothetical protein